MLTDYLIQGLALLCHWLTPCQLWPACLRWRVKRADNRVMFSRRRQKVSALIALCAVLFAGLLPASSALARATVFVNDALVMGVICTTHGGKVTSVPSPSSTPSVPLAAHGHCALCVISGSAALMPCAIAVNSLTVAPAGVPTLPASSAPPRENFALHPLIPRAPPGVI